MDADVFQVQSPGVDRVLRRLLGSTLGQKAVVAVTGAALVGFAFVHMAGHLLMFQGAEAYNKYAHTLQSMGALKWAARGGLLVAVALHVWASLQLTMRNRAARPIDYSDDKWLAASFGARTMRLSGPLLLFFIVYHLLHFTVMAVTADGYADMEATIDGNLVVADAYGRMLSAFSYPALTVLYVGAVGLLGVHLSHGIQSIFQTLGLNNGTYRPLVRRVGPLLAGIVTAGFAVVPLAILAQFIR